MGVLLKKFKEFHTNYSVLEKIDDRVPKEVLRWKYNQLAHIIKNLHSNKEIIIENIKNRENYGVFKRNYLIHSFTHHILLNTKVGPFILV